MADIFVSYAREDMVRASALAEALQALGWSVWRDDRITTGAAFDHVIEEQLDAASCVLVMWSSASLPSEWVRAEAAAAKEQGKLLPISFERDLRPPLLFRQLSVAFLTSTDLSERTPSAMGLLADIARMTGKAPHGVDPAMLHAVGRERSLGANLVTAGRWRITTRFLGMRARYDVTLHPTGMVTGTGKLAISRATIAGTWYYDPAEQTLHLHMSGGIQEGTKAIPVQITKWTSGEAAECIFDGRRAHIERIRP